MKTVLVIDQRRALGACLLFADKMCMCNKVNDASGLAVQSITSKTVTIIPYSDLESGVSGKTGHHQS